MPASTERGQKTLTAHRLRFTVEVETPLELPPWPGGNIRGALLNALRRHYCPAPDDPDPGHSARCPVCWLMAREDPAWRWGKNPARPYAIETEGPAFALGQRFTPGQRFSFDITLFGNAFHLFPYLILALGEMGRTGLGRRLEENRGRRGRFRLYQAEAVHPLTGERQTILSPGSTTVHTPQLALDESQVLAYARTLLRQNPRRLRLTFLSPARIIQEKRLVKEPAFAPLFDRTLERLEALKTQYGEPSASTSDWPDVHALRACAREVRLVEHETRWVEVRSASRRTGHATPTSGFVGWAEYEAEDWAPLLPVLVWAVATHVGKDAVKGNGLIQLFVRGTFTRVPGGISGGQKWPLSAI